MSVRVIFPYTPGKAWHRTVGEAWLEGCARFVGEVMTARPDEVDVDPHAIYAFYGVLPKSVRLYSEVLHHGIDHYYIDNAYFSAGHGEDKYLRVTLNAEQHDGLGEGSVHRFLDHGLALRASMRTGGSHVLIACQSEWWYARHGVSFATWLDDTVTTLRRHTDREIRVRLKPRARYKLPPNVSPRVITKPGQDTPLSEDLKDCWALVTHSSNAAVEAILCGVPVFTTARCAATSMGYSDLSLIERPRYPSFFVRQNWAWSLANNQWTLREIREGACWRSIGVRSPHQVAVAG